MSESLTSPRRVLAAQRRAEIVRLRVEGRTLQAIADEIGLSRSAVHESLTNELKKLADRSQEEAAVYRELTLARLEALFAALWPQAQAGHVPSVNAAVSILDRQAKLLGLDAPSRHETKLTVERMTDAELIAEAERLGLPVPPELLDPHPATIPFPNRAG